MWLFVLPPLTCVRILRALAQSDVPYRHWIASPLDEPSLILSLLLRPFQQTLAAVFALRGFSRILALRPQRLVLDLYLPIHFPFQGLFQL